MDKDMEKETDSSLEEEATVSPEQARQQMENYLSIKEKERETKEAIHKENMKDLEYVSSAGLRAIRNLYIKVNQNGGKLSLTNVNENVMEVFEMTGLAGLLNIRE